MHDRNILRVALAAALALTLSVQAPAQTPAPTQAQSASAAAVLAQDYPARPIRFIVSTAAGTTVDSAARYMAAKLSEEWAGAPIVVENRVGANTAIASEYVAKAAPDGYTLLFTAGAHYATRWMIAKLPYDPVEDFRPVARVGVAYLVLVVPANAKSQTLTSLIAEMQAQPGALTYASAGNGSATHLSSVLLTSMAGVSARHVPYKGAAQALTDTIGGQVQFTVAGISTARAHIQAGRLRALGVTGSKRSALLPDVPAIAEANLPGYALTTMVGLLAPRAVPPAIVNKLSNALLKLGATADYKAFAANQGMEADLAGTEKFSAEAAPDLEHWRRVIALSGAQPD